MDRSELIAVSPIDGRYRSKVNELSDYFSEAALIRYRVEVEVRYFLSLVKVIPFLHDHASSLDASILSPIYEDFTLSDAERIKEIEKITNHDVKAVEYFIKEKFDSLGLSAYKEFIHFGLTSQDINNTAIPMMYRDAVLKVFLPRLISLIDKMDTLADSCKDVSMLARTHGQPASPTTMGKEIRVFVYRLRCQLAELERIPHSGKFGGATGNFNAHHIAYPEIDWVDFSDRFLRSELGLEREKFTTQISNYDFLSASFDAQKRIATILIDFSRDVWQYISMEYFRQKVKEGEVGSSAMPHKVNPIDFENAEGNLGIAVAYFEHLSGKLPISRLQRDLTDSTVTRNIGMPLAHALIALTSLEKGLSKLLLNEEAIRRDLDQAWAVCAEGIQTILRRIGYANPYEALKALTRGNTQVTAETLSRFIDQLDVEESIKEELRRITPFSYTGIA